MFERFDKNRLQPIAITQFDPPKIIDGYFSNGRIDKNTVPEGWVVYDLLEGENGEFIKLMKYVPINHGGSVALPEKLDIPACGYFEFLDIDATNRATATADYTF